jgi:hypothetical protein
MRAEIKVGDIVTVNGSILERTVVKTGCGSDGARIKLDGLGNDCYAESSVTKVRDGVRRSIRRPVVTRQFGDVTMKSDRLSATHKTEWLDDDTLAWFQTHEFRINVEYESERKDDVYAEIANHFPAVEIGDGGFTPASPGRQFWEGTVYLYATKGSELPLGICNQTLRSMVKDNSQALNNDKTAIRLINRIDAVLDLLGHGFKLGVNVPVTI